MAAKATPAMTAPPWSPYLRQTYLQRLERLCRIRRYGQDGCGHELDDVALRMVDNAIEATIRDCWDVGAAGAAARIKEATL